MRNESRAMVGRIAAIAIAVIAIGVARVGLAADVIDTSKIVDLTYTKSAREPAGRRECLRYYHDQYGVA
jgi:hypothetical protein